MYIYIYIYIYNIYIYTIRICISLSLSLLLSLSLSLYVCIWWVSECVVCVGVRSLLMRAYVFVCVFVVCVIVC